jgi:hypothetical protein
MDITKLRGLIQESIQEYLKDIDEAGNRAAVEAKMAKIDEAIKSREDKISRAEALTEDEDMKEMVNTGKISSLKKEIKLFEKAKSKYQKQLDKMDGKKEPKKEIDEFTDLSQDGKGLGIGPIVPPDDFDKPKKENMNESFVRMQKLAGVITEGMDTGIDYEGAGDKYEMFDRMDGLANIQDLKVLNAKLRLLVSDWYNEGFEKDEIKEYINFLIDEI